MKDTVINEKNVKIPLYVAAYETISQWLKDGKYKAGDSCRERTSWQSSSRSAGVRYGRPCCSCRKMV